MTTNNHIVHVTTIPVRWSDFDRFGHITNSVYIELAQEARQVVAYEQFSSGTIEAPTVFVRKLEVDYLRPIMPNTVEVTVETTVTEVGSTSFTTRQELKDVEGKLCAIVEAVQVAIDLHTTRPRAITAQEFKILTQGK